MPLKAPLIESVRMNVPVTIATPSTIAIAVSAGRSLRPKRPARATFSMAKRLRASRDAVHRGQDLRRLAPCELVGDDSVGEEHDPVGDRAHGGVVGDHHVRL